MSIYQGIINSDNNDIKTKFLKTLVTEKSSLHNDDDYKKRTRFLIRAVIGEYTCSTCFFTVVFGTLSNCYINNYDQFQTSLVASLVTAFTAISMIFSYSEISGAIFNPAISLALWLTGKLSNRKLILYVVFQVLGGFTALFIIFCSFNDSSGLYKNLLRKPVGSDIGRIFASEFFATFILTYTVFVIILEDAESQKKEVKTFKYADGITVYSTKGGKNAFSPFVFGFILFGLINIGGCSGNVMNPVIILVPALVTFRFEHVWIYFFAEFAAACFAAALVHLQHIKVDEKLERSTILGDEVNDDLRSSLLK